MSAGLELGVGILHAVRRGLLSLVLLVVPRHAGLDMRQIDVLAVQYHLTEDSSISLSCKAANTQSRTPFLAQRFARV
jgi:hypothetical protein